MKVVRCDICGKDIEEGRRFYLGIVGHKVIKYTGRDGNEYSRGSFEYDLCEKCARKAAEMLGRMTGTEGQDVQGDD